MRQPQDFSDVVPAGVPTPSTVELTMKGISVGGLRLGMSLSDAQKTGLLGQAWDRQPEDKPTGCSKFEGRHGVLEVVASSRGVHRIEVYPFIQTPEGVGMGATYAKVATAYPGTLPTVPGSEAIHRVPVPGYVGAWYQFRFATDAGGDVTKASRVMSFALQNADLACE
jgi:hypothetical protein